MKKLSVVVPIYNVSDYVAKAAQCLAEQAHELLEVIAVDDGSTDGSLDVFLQNMIGVDVVAISQKNSGLSSARNAGIQVATSEYILFLDADDFLLPNAVENILGLLECESPDVIFGRYLMWTPHSGFRKAKPYNYNPPQCKQKRMEYILCDLPDPSWNAWRYICRRDFILNNELFFIEGILCEDVPWTLSVLEIADTIKFLQEPFYAYYHRRPGSIMNSANPQMLVDLNGIVTNKLQKYNCSPKLCTMLVRQSFFYISEYCLFAKQDRPMVFASYQSVIPLYKKSQVIFHSIVGLFSFSIWLYLVSLGLFTVRCLYRIFTRLKYS